MMKALSLTGLDAQNPLGFFTALGLLRVLDDHAQRRGLERPRLAFSDVGEASAQLWTAHDYASMCDLVLHDAQEQASSATLRLAYDDAGALVSDCTASQAIRDLKMSPSAAGEFLAKLTSGPRRDADLAAGLLSDLAQDNNGRAKPTSFHFTAGQQAFLLMVEALRVGLTREALDEALLGPWMNTSRLPSLAWDSSVTRLYALRAGDPAKEKRGSVPAANWLSVHALAYFPVTGRGGRGETTGVAGGWKTSVFTWPIWRVPVSAAVVASLLKLDCGRMREHERLALGVSEVLSSRILRSDQGGYGSFTPAEVVVPKRPARFSEPQ